MYVAKRHLLTSFEAQEAHFFAKKYLIMDYKIYTYTYDFLNHVVGGITEEMTIYKHVLKKTTTKKNKHRFSDTFCISRRAFLFCFYCAY